MSFSITCYASEYDEIAESVSEEYEVQISKNYGAEKVISLDDFTAKVENIAQQQSSINHLTTNVSLIPQALRISTYATTYKSKTVKKPASPDFYIKATYDYATTAPHYVKNFRSISYGYRYMLSDASFSKYSGYPKTSTIDSGRTGVVKYVGRFEDSSVSVNNYTISAEFYYSD